MHGKLNISYILSGRGRAGGIRVTVDSATEMLRRGHTVRILYHKPRFEFGKWVRQTVRRVRRPWRYDWIPPQLRYGGRHDWLDKFSGPVESFDNLNECEFKNGEILIGVGIYGCAALDDLKTQDVVPLQYFHGMSFGSETLRMKACQADLPKIVVSSSLVKAVEERGGQAPFAVVPNGIYLQEYFPSISQDYRDGIGGMYSSADKNDPATFIATIQHLRTARPQLPLRIFGAVRKPRQFAGMEYIRLPSVELAREIYSKSLVWLVASKHEGFCLPILEAMACGCAVVSTDCGGPRDIIQHGVNGFLVDVGDVDAIVEHACKLIDDADLRRRFVENGFETVKKFSWERATDELEAAIAKAIQWHEPKQLGEINANG